MCFCLKFSPSTSLTYSSDDETSAPFTSACTPGPSLSSTSGNVGDHDKDMAASDTTQEMDNAKVCNNKVSVM